MIKNKDEVMVFLRDHNPVIVGCSTMESGYVTCIKPVKGICNAELMCNHDTVSELKLIVNGEVK